MNHGIIALLTAFAAGLGFFQLLPGQTDGLLRSKLIILPVGVTVATFIACLLLLRHIRTKADFSAKIRCRILITSLFCGALIVSVFHMSLPQKEFFLPRHTIYIESDAPVDFLSLHNTYRGVSLSEFTHDEYWVRVDDRLRYGGERTGSPVIFTGGHGKSVELFFSALKNDADIHMDWGDGCTEDFLLSAENDTSVRVVHLYDGTNGAEWINFLFNLIPVFALMTWIFALWFMLMTVLMRSRSRQFRVIFIVLTVCTVFMRIYNVYDFPLCWDEGTYARAAIQYTDKIVNFRWSELPDIMYNHEHPAFVKFMNSLPSVMDGRSDFEYFGLNRINHPHDKPEDYTIFTGRLVSSACSVLTMQALVCFFHPLAGFFWLINSYAESYGAQARLEAIPMLTSLLAVWCFMRMLRDLKNGNARRAGNLLALSALFLGITAASKFIYCVIVVPMGLMALDALCRKELHFKQFLFAMLGMCLLSLSSFYIFNSSIWKHPIERIGMEFTFHGDYKEGHKTLYPWWYPICWVTRSVAHQSGIYFEKSPLAVNPQHFFFSCDELIFLLAILGVKTLFRRERVYVLWFITAMLFLFYWGTKWEQYTCITIVPICVSAYYGTLRAARWLLKFRR